MKILALGGDGFLGSHFVDRAVALGHDVTVFDRFPYDMSRNLEHQRRRAAFVSGEFANRDDVRHALEGQDIVYHLISATSPIVSWNDPYVDIDENLRHSVQFFELAVAAGVGKVVFVSSGGTVYGPQDSLVGETCLPRPFNPHGICKLAIEHFLNYYREKSGLQADVYRIGNVYGPRQPMRSPQGVVAVWMSRILKGEDILVYGDAETLRDYVFVEDAAYLMTHSLDDPGRSEVLNVGTGRGTSVIELLEIFREAIDIPFNSTIVSPRRPSDNTRAVLDSSQILSYFPEFTFGCLEDKIRETWHAVKGSTGGFKIL